MSKFRSRKEGIVLHHDDFYPTFEMVPSPLHLSSSHPFFHVLRLQTSPLITFAHPRFALLYNKFKQPSSSHRRGVAPLSSEIALIHSDTHKMILEDVSYSRDDIEDPFESLARFNCTTIEWNYIFRWQIVLESLVLLLRDVVIICV